MSGLSLIRALDQQDREQATSILQTMPSEVSMKDSDDRVALHYAVETMDLATIEQVYDQDPTLVDCQDRVGHTPLLLAVMAGRVDVIQFLLEHGADLGHVDKDGHSAVHWAVVCGQLDALVYIIKKKASVSVPDHLNSTPLHYSTVSEDIPHELSISILLVLLRAGANPNAVDIDQRTPILWSASNGNLEAIQSLKQAGGDIHALDRDRLSVLHCAASHGFHDIIDYFMECSPRNFVDQRDRSGHTSLFYAVTFGHYEATKKLLAYGANPNHQDNRLRTPSHCAAAKGQLRMLKLLRQFSGSFQIQNYRGDLPVHEAVQAGGKDLVEWFLALNPESIDSQNHEGRTCLHLAAATGNIEMVVFLCSRGCFINPLMLFKGSLYTPLDLAIRKDHQVIVEYLRMRYSAVKAEDIDEGTKSQSKSIYEEKIEQGRLRVGRHLEREESVTDMASSKRRARVPRRRSSDAYDEERQFVNAGVNTTGRRASSADGRGPEVKSTSTTDLQAQSKEAASSFARELAKELSNIRNFEMMKSGKSAVKADKHQKSNKNKSDAPSPTKSTSTADFTDLPGISDSSDLEDMEPTPEEVMKENRVPEKASLQKRSKSEPREKSAVAPDRRKNLRLVSGAKMRKKPNQVVKIKEVKGGDSKNKTIMIVKKDDQRNADVMEIYEDDWEGLEDHDHPVGKDAARRYIHEKAIFQELTHLKRMQIQYGRVQEKILVRSLVSNFCKMHGLDPANFKFHTFYAWEKFLYDRLKTIYLDERQRLTIARNTPKQLNDKSSHFETRLRQARAIPLNEKVQRMSRRNVVL
ncbi:unnamed protein product [Auanema sp. JU1783]|nr:unnamed protein product [Auanema sp. JU1783]